MLARQPKWKTLLLLGPLRPLLPRAPRAAARAFLLAPHAPLGRAMLLAHAGTLPRLLVVYFTWMWFTLHEWVSERLHAVENNGLLFCAGGD